MYEISGSSLPLPLPLQLQTLGAPNNSEKSRVVNAKYSATLGGKLLKVENNNGSSFVMAMPRGDSVYIEGLAIRKWPDLILPDSANG
ncbi:hypothetical protein [Erwinia amylovora]|uniref:hypothetical protein n=1 Tax=Erwinia amylovora TaxID=552 RepID=UPI000528FBBA|nr:hypothetical protein [Erwinia amylovora]